jgi:hypothetical protein
MQLRNENDERITRNERRFAACGMRLRNQERETRNQELTDRAQR